MLIYVYLAENALTLLQLGPLEQRVVEDKVLEGQLPNEDVGTLALMRKAMLRRMMVVCREFIGKERVSASQAPTTAVRVGNHHVHAPQAQRLLFKAVKVESMSWTREIRAVLQDLAREQGT